MGWLGCPLTNRSNAAARLLKRRRKAAFAQHLHGQRGYIFDIPTETFNSPIPNSKITRKLIFPLLDDLCYP
jgi:hypothetical protein